VGGIADTSKKVANLTNQVFGSRYKKAVLNELKQLYDVLFTYFAEAMWYNSTIISNFGSFKMGYCSQ
jgi:hypothetical protein